MTTNGSPTTIAYVAGFLASVFFVYWWKKCQKKKQHRSSIEWRSYMRSTSENVAIAYFVTVFVLEVQCYCIVTLITKS